MPITDSKLWKKYSEELSASLRKADPTITDDEISRQLKRISENLTVPIVNRETTLEDVPDVKETLYKAIDDIMDDDCIISAAGVIVEPHNKHLSPFVPMIAGWKLERGSVKKQMFQAMDVGNSDLARYFDKLQLNLKSNKMNALYGILALVSSAFFHEYFPYAVTWSGRQLISYTVTSFEALVGNNMRFLSMDECIEWIETVRRKHQNDKVDAFIIHPTAEQVYKRLVDHFLNWQGDECDYLMKYIHGLDRSELVFVYYANNMFEFIKSHKKMMDLLRQVYSGLPTDLTKMDPDPVLWKKYGEGKELNSSNWRKMLGKQLFLDPYSPPAQIKEPLDEFCEILRKYCFVPYMFQCIVSRINKLKRKCVGGLDTDSAFLHSDDFVDLSMSIMSKLDTGIRGQEINEAISFMTLIYFLNPCIDKMLEYYLLHRRIDKEYHKHCILKNEWFYNTRLIMPVKKRYAGMPMIREGLILPDPKPDTKGVDYLKGNTPKEIQKRFTNIMINRVLTSGDADIAGLVSDVNKISEEIKASILKGETKYWKIATYKDASAYDHPERIQVWKGGQLWNRIYPDNKLESLDKACVAKLKKGAVINDVACGNVIAAPMTLKVVPKEIVDQLDVDLMVYNIISTFNSVMDCFPIETETVKTVSGAKIKKRTGLIQV